MNIHDQENVRNRFTRALDRRQFLAGVGALSLSGYAQAHPLALAQKRKKNKERTLILVELNGGNDGLSTVIPVTDKKYLQARRSALVKPGDAIKLDGIVGLNPALAKVGKAFADGHAALVQGVGLSNGIRSHFSATDIWHSADPKRGSAQDGWIARLGDMAWEGRGSNAVVHFGANPLGAHYSKTRAPLAVENPAQFASLGAGPNEAGKMKPKKRGGKKGKGKSSGNPALDRVRQIAKEADRQSLRVRAATAGYRSPVQFPGTPLGSNVRDICALLNLPDEETPRVLSTTFAGFDTHARQKGAHDRQLTALDAALGAMLQDLGRTEVGRNAVVVVYSEFGRRVAENGSQGTDHGKGGVVFVLGHAIETGIYGEYPDLEELDNGDLAVTTDFRSVYATLIEDLFDQDAHKLLGVKMPKVPFLG